MENSERELIRSRLCDLILHTNCSTDFLTFLQEKKTLSIFDIESIAAKNEGSDRASEFYKIIVTRTSGFQNLLNALEKTRQIKPLQILTGAPEGENVSLSVEEIRKRVEKLLRDESSKPSISFDVDPPVHLFTGRTKELEELHAMILKSKEGKTVTVISQLATVSGLGGIGKTQLARQYIGEKSWFFNENVIWLNAENQGSLSTSFLRLAAEKLKLSTKDGNGTDKSAKAVAAEVYKYFEDRKALFVLDNAALKEDGGPWLRELLPNPKKNPDLYILMTSRKSDWGVGAKVMSLAELTQAEAVSMVKLGLEIEEENDEVDDEIIKLTEVLQCFPLALHQAISYICEQRQMSVGYPIQTYISEFEGKKQEMMLSYRDLDSIDDTYMLTTTTTWKITVEKIKAHPEFGAIAISVLKVMSYYNPTNIWRDLFYDLKTISAITDSNVKPITTEKINASIQLLVKYSMINSTNQDQNILNIHRLVQAVTRFQMERIGENSPFLAATMYLKNFCRDDGETFHVKNVEHGLAVWRHSWKHPQRTLKVTAVVHLVLLTLLVCGRIDEGIDMCNEALIKYKDVFEEEDVVCFEVKEIQAVMLALKGCRKEAANIFKKLLDETRLMFGKESERFQNVELGISGILKSLGIDTTDKDLNSIVKDFKLKTASLGETHEITLEAQASLAEYQMDNELDKDALETLKDLIDKYNTAYGTDSAEALEAETNVARIYFKIGRKEEALHLFQNVHELFFKFPEKYSSELMRFCLRYANVLQEVDRTEDAISMLENCKNKLTEVYGSQHLWMPNLLNESGDCQLTIGKFKEALNAHSEALRCERAITGGISRNCLKYKKVIAFDLLLLGKVKESLTLFNDVQDQIDALRMFDVADNPNFVKILKWSGNDLEALKLLIRMINSHNLAKDIEKIEALSKEIILIRQKLEMKKKIQAICSSALRADISFRNARSKLIELLDNNSVLIDENPDLYALTNLFIVRFCIHFRYFEISLRRLNLVYTYIENRFLINQKPALNMLIAIGDLYFGIKNYEKAFENHKAVYEKLSDLHGDLYVTTIEAKIRIATDLFCKGSHDHFFLMFEEITQILKQLEVNNPNENDLTLNMLNYAMETVTIIFKDASPCAKQILEVIGKIKKSLEPKVLIDQLNWAEGFVTTGNYEEALKMYKDVYQKGGSPIWNADMLEVVTACKNLAHVLNQLGKHDEALEILEGNLELVKLNLGSEHHWTYLLKGSLADAHRGVENFAEAYRLHNEAYQGLLITLDEDHEDMLVLKKEIAVDLSVLGRHEESNCSFLEVLDKLETTSGKDSYEVIVAKIEFAEAIERSNDGLQVALAILVKVNEAMTEVLDNESVLFQRVSKLTDKLVDNLFNEPFNRAEEFIKTGNYEEALQVYKKEINRKAGRLNCMADIKLFASTGKKVADGLLKMGKHKESLAFLEKVLELVKDEVGNEDPLIVSLMWKLARLHQSLGHFDMALDIRQRAHQLLGNKTKIKIRL